LRILTIRRKCDLGHRNKAPEKPGKRPENEPIRGIVPIIMDSALNVLRAENARLETENIQLRAKIRALSMSVTAERTCIDCLRILPDNAAYFPGMLEPIQHDGPAEWKRHSCVYCRAESDDDDGISRRL
jgi:hypothetical protein